MSRTEKGDDALLNPERRSFLKTAAAGGAVAAAGGLAELTSAARKPRPTPTNRTRPTTN